MGLPVAIGGTMGHEEAESQHLSQVQPAVVAPPRLFLQLPGQQQKVNHREKMFASPSTVLCALSYPTLNKCVMSSST